MSPDRLVHKTVQVQYVRIRIFMQQGQQRATLRHSIVTRNNSYEEHNTGDLLMDVPSKLSWEGLKQLAANRDAWRLRVKAITGETRITVQMSGTGGKVSRNLLKPSTPGRKPS